MKKILAIVLALSLVLALSVTAFAADSPTVDSPSLPSAPQGSTNGVLAYTVTDADGNPVVANIEAVTSGDVYDELKDAGLIALYEVKAINAPADTVVTIKIGAKGITEDAVVIVRDAWEVLPEVTLVAGADVAEITAPAGVLTQWKYVAIVKADSEIVVETPQESADTEEEDETVNEPAPEVDAEPEPEPEPAPAPADDDANPGTGIALAVVPMIVAAAAVAVSKKR